MRSFTSLLLALPAILAAPTPLDQSKIIPGSWIVHLNDKIGFLKALDDAPGLLDVKPSHVFSIGDFHGVAIDGLPTTDALLKLPGIASIEPNTRVSASALVTQTDAPWGLGRISHKKVGAKDYVYDASAGKGTFAYIIDTGIRTSHADFQGRATFGVNYADATDTDLNGHGTHVAGTVGSATYGVAKKTTLIGVKVLDANGGGTIANVIKGIEWAVADMKAKKRKGKAVANLSLGGGFSQIANDAVAAAANAGLFVAVAAGNDGKSASAYSPASEPLACTVGATDATDAFATFSNYGPSVDILAPGVQVQSTWFASDSAVQSLSGTSMATPHVAGLAAYLLALEGPKSPTQLCDRIKTLSIKEKVDFGTNTLAKFSTANKLAYNGNKL